MTNGWLQVGMVLNREYAKENTAYGIGRAKN